MLEILDGFSLVMGHHLEQMSISSRHSNLYKFCSLF